MIQTFTGSGGCFKALHLQANLPQNSVMGALGRACSATFWSRMLRTGLSRAQSEGSEDTNPHQSDMQAITQLKVRGAGVP